MSQPAKSILHQMQNHMVSSVDRQQKILEKKEKYTMISNINPVKSIIIKKRFAIILNSNKIVTITLPVKSFT